MKHNPMPPDEVRRLVRSDEATGHLFWLPRSEEMFPKRRIWLTWKTVYEGRPAFRTPHSNGYLSGRLGGRTEYAHRVVWCILAGEWPPSQIDHINGIRSDNRPVNLRLATNAANACNYPSRSGSKSRFKGVSPAWRRDRWIAQITKGGKATHLGTFDNEEEAARAYDAAAIHIHGEFARLNFPREEVSNAA